MLTSFLCPLHGFLEIFSCSLEKNWGFRDTILLQLYLYIKHWCICNDRINFQNKKSMEQFAHVSRSYNKTSGVILTTEYIYNICFCPLGRRGDIVFDIFINKKIFKNALYVYLVRTHTILAILFIWPNSNPPVFLLLHKDELYKRMLNMPIRSILEKKWIICRRIARQT